MTTSWESPIEFVVMYWLFSGLIASGIIAIGIDTFYRIKDRRSKEKIK